MNKILFFIVALGMSIAVSSCKKGNEVIPVTYNNIKGTWKHDYNIEPDFTMPPEYKRMEFVNDSFYLTYRWRKELLSIECPDNTGIWYIKGQYKLEDGKKMYFNGNFTDPDFVVLTIGSGCDSIGNYIDSFNISMRTKEILDLYWLIPHSSMPESHRKIELKRIK